MYPVAFLLEFLAPCDRWEELGSGAATRTPSDIAELKEGGFVFENTVRSLLSGGHWCRSPQWLGRPRSSLSVLSEPLGAVRAGWLPDSVTVWSGVLWGRGRIIAPCPGRKDETKIRKYGRKGNTLAAAGLQLLDIDAHSWWAKPLKTWIFGIITGQCWVCPEAAHRGRRCLVFFSWLRHTRPRAGPKTWPVAWACSGSKVIPTTRCSKAASKCGSEEGGLLVGSRLVSPWRSSM